MGRKSREKKKGILKIEPAPLKYIGFLKRRVMLRHCAMAMFG